MTDDCLRYQTIRLEDGIDPEQLDRFTIISGEEEADPRGGGVIMSDRFDGRRRGRRKVDRFLADKSLVIDYKDPSALKYFVTERGKIVPRRVSGLCAKNQRKITSH